MRSCPNPHAFAAARRWLVASLAVTAVALAAPAAQAAPYQFAQFNIPTDGSPFSLTNNGGTSATIGVTNAPVTFNFTTATGLGTQDHPAFLNLAPIVPPSAFSPAIVMGSLVDQPINDLEKLTITSGANGTGTNFLTLFFTGDLIGLLGGNNGSIQGSDSGPNARVVSYTSDFGTFTAPGNSYNLALADINPTLSIGPGGFLNSFIANIGGQFTGNFVGTAAVPAPASVILYGFGMSGVAALARWRRRRVAN